MPHGFMLMVQSRSHVFLPLMCRLAHFIVRSGRLLLVRYVRVVMLLLVCILHDATANLRMVWRRTDILVISRFLKLY